MDERKENKQLLLVFLGALVLAFSAVNAHGSLYQDGMTVQNGGSGTDFHEEMHEQMEEWMEMGGNSHGQMHSGMMGSGLTHSEMHERMHGEALSEQELEEHCGRMMMNDGGMIE